jgi:hypothetical protein
MLYLGGCLRPCAAPLQCGHRCPHKVRRLEIDMKSTLSVILTFTCVLKCHANDPNHISTKCYERCLKLCSVLSHPCDRKCFECTKGCGDCMFPVSNIALPCGHTHPRAPWYVCSPQLDSLFIIDLGSGSYLAQFPGKIKCLRTVNKQLPSCEHTANMPCHQDPITYECQERCGIDYPCCSRSCNATCGRCQVLNTAQEGQARIPRTLHPPHPCGRRLFCGHDCKDNCENGHVCSGLCSDTCRQTCPHNVCRKSCSIPCNPCVERCSWVCGHLTCPATCGMVSSSYGRLCHEFT